MITVYMTTIVYKSGVRDRRFSGNKRQYGACKASLKWRHDVDRIELVEIHPGILDCTLIETVDGGAK